VIPEGCAHGFLTLEDESEVFYMISAPYVPEAARGVRFDDPAFGIRWPGEVRVIHKRDRTYPDTVPDASVGGL
jgi:dTDP-4-dehydrorhamnose 3,5-epimerase